MMSTADNTNPVDLQGQHEKLRFGIFNGRKKTRYLARPETQTQTDFFLVPQVVQQHANINWKAFKRWYGMTYTAVAGVVVPELAKQEIRRILVRYDGHHPVTRADLCPDTLAILDAWSAVPLVPGSREHVAAQRRMIRDILYEKLAGPTESRYRQAFKPKRLLPLLRELLSEDTDLPKLDPMGNSVGDAYTWIYRTRSGEFARHQVYRQPFCYHVLARDGVTTLRANFSPDNEHLYGGASVSSLSLPKIPLVPLPANDPAATNERFHPYARARATAKPSTQRTVEEPPVALHVQDPSFPKPIEDPSLPTLIMDSAHAESTPSNEVTLDQLIQEAKNKTAIVGYTEALSRGLLRPKGRRVQWDNRPPENREDIREPEQTAKVETLRPPQPGSIEPEQATEETVTQIPRPGAIEALEEMFQVPHVQLRGGIPSVVSCDSEPFEHLRYLDRL